MISIIERKVKNYSQISALAKKFHRENKKIVFATGCFDLLHFGHSFFFEKAKEHGDILIVGVGNDKTLKALKGSGRPILSERIRAAMVASQMFVDYAVILKEPLKAHKDDHSNLMTKIKPLVFVVNKDDSALSSKKAIIESLGGSLVSISRIRPKGIPYISTTSICEKIQKLGT